MNFPFAGYDHQKILQNTDKSFISDKGQLPNTGQNNSELIIKSQINLDQGGKGQNFLNVSKQGMLSQK